MCCVTLNESFTSSNYYLIKKSNNNILLKNNNNLFLFRGKWKNIKVGSTNFIKTSFVNSSVTLNVIYKLNKIKKKGIQLCHFILKKSIKTFHGEASLRVQTYAEHVKLNLIN